MGKYLEALKLLYGDSDNISDSLEPRTDVTDKGLPFVSTVSSTSRDIENIQASNEQASVPFTDHELAEHQINGLRLRDDRVFVHQKLIGIYGKKRLELVNQYFDEWRKGSKAETNVNKIENTGRYRANTWLRDRHE
jgi:hypothetical protein